MAKSKPKFQKLTPIRDADIGIYCEALDYVFENDDLRNVAVSGAYSAGKSSVLESYKTKHSDKRFIHISLAHFEDAKGDALMGTQKDETSHDTIKESVLEGKILNQLIHQISPSRIPQTNFRVKQKVASKKVMCWASAIVVFALALFHMIYFSDWKSYVMSIASKWIRTALSLSIMNGSRLLSGAICVALVGVLLYFIIRVQVNRGLFKKISADKFEIEIFEGSEDSYFDKYLNEVLYLFDQCEADVIVFEDMDRYNANRIFERLREVNNLINVQRSKQNGTTPLRFFYLLRDDIFVSKDRTKFFDFIIPVVPVVDGSNSYDQFIRHLTESDVLELFDEPFLQGLSLYIDDMRILKNICNEFLIYNSRLNTTELGHNKLMAMIAYKNLFPRDFNDLQLGRGFVFALFDKKEQFIVDKVTKLSATLEIATARLEATKREHLDSLHELDLVTADKRITVENTYCYQRQQKQEHLRVVETEYKQRKQAIEDRDNNRMPDLEAEILRLEGKIAATKNETLQEVINRDNITEIFATASTNEVGAISDFKEIRGNDYFALLKYLIRNGYIDESYADYMTYFYEHSLSRTDKIFLRSVSDQIKKEPDYQLKEPQKIFARLNVVHFSQPEVLNYDLLFYLLQKCASDYIIEETEGTTTRRGSLFPVFFPVTKNKTKERQCLDAMLVQMLDVTWNPFLQSAFIKIQDTRLNYLVNYLNSMRKEFLVSVLLKKAEFASGCADDFVFRTFIAAPENDLLADDSLSNALSAYISNHPQFLDKERFEESKLQTMFGNEFLVLDVNQGLINRLEKLEVRFRSLYNNRAHSQLFTGVYNCNLYELSFANIAHLLVVKYGLSESEDFKHKNYTLIKTQPASPLARYVEESIDDYIAEILTACGDRIEDDEAIVLDVLNNESISDVHKAEYVNVLTTVIQRITDIEDSALWQQLLSAERVAHTERNVLDYYCAYDHSITDELLDFMNKSDNEYDYTEVREEYEDETQSKFFNSALRCNRMNNKHYSAILKTLGRVYNKGFGVEGVAADKIFILIDIGVIPMHKDSLAFLREHHPRAVMSYIRKHIATYVAEMQDEGIFNLDEVLEVLLTTIADKYKLGLLKRIGSPLTARKSQYSDTVRAHILTNNLFEADISHFIASYPSEGALTKAAIEKIAQEKIQDIFDHEYDIDKRLVDTLLALNISYDIKLKLFSLLLPALDESVCKRYLGQLGLQDYLSLFNQKRPKIKKSSAATHILDTFRRRGWITKFEADEKETGYYRAYGRKMHTDDEKDKVALL